MKNMQKSLQISFCLVLAFTQNILAERSGAFFGLDIGYGGVAYHQIREAEIRIADGGTPCEFATTPNYCGNQGDELERQAGGVNFGFVVGYKQFFTPYIGLRYYVNASYTRFYLGEFKSPPQYYQFVQIGEIDKSKSEKLVGGNVNYGVNVDFLWNFIANEKVDFGGFLGVGLGGNYWAGDNVGTSSLRINSFEKYGQKMLGCYTCLSMSGFDVWLNVGLRTNIAQKHGVELVCRVPFLQTNIYSEDFTHGDGSIFVAKGYIQQIYSIAARYIYNF